jgi:hypothetical protein
MNGVRGRALAGLLPKSVMHCCARYEPGGRGFKSCRARQYSKTYEL